MALPVAGKRAEPSARQDQAAVHHRPWDGEAGADRSARRAVQAPRLGRDAHRRVAAAPEALLQASQDAAVQWDVGLWERFSNRVAQLEALLDAAGRAESAHRRALALGTVLEKPDALELPAVLETRRPSSATGEFRQLVAA